MSDISLPRVKRGDKYTENIIYVLDYTSCQAMFWILYSESSIPLFFSQSSGFIFMPASLSLSETSLRWWMCSTAFLLYMIISSMETKQHWSVHVAHVHGALEEAKVLASSYCLNSNRPLCKWRSFCIDLLLESASIHLKSKTPWQAVEVWGPSH